MRRRRRRPRRRRRRRQRRHRVGRGEDTRLAVAAAGRWWGGGRGFLHARDKGNRPGEGGRGHGFPFARPKGFIHSAAVECRLSISAGPNSCKGIVSFRANPQQASSPRAPCMSPAFSSQQPRTNQRIVRGKDFPACAHWAPPHDVSAPTESPVVASLTLAAASNGRSMPIPPRTALRAAGRR